jgi:hypothetical protein
LAHSYGYAPPSGPAPITTIPARSSATGVRNPG